MFVFNCECIFFSDCFGMLSVGCATVLVQKCDCITGGSFDLCLYFGIFKLGNWVRSYGSCESLSGNPE
jgi:hypothetical protein